MNAQDVETIGQVIEQALAAQRKTLEALIEQRRAECTDAQQATELAREQVTQAEDRLRDFLDRRSSDAVLAMQHAAAAELTRSQDLLLRKLQAADALAAEVRDLREQLARAQPRSAYDIAITSGFTGSEADWVASLKGQPGEAPDAAAIIDTLMRTHGEQLAGKPGECGVQGLAGPPGERGERGDPGSQGERGQDGRDGRDGAGIDAPPWSAGIHREGALVQAYMGQHYRALRDTSAEPYASADWQRVGTMGLHLAQPFAEGIEYALGDLVVRDYSTFVVDERGQLHLFAARGPVGERGREGAKGRDGTDGTNGKDGRDGYGIENVQLAGGTLAILARNAAGQTQDFAIDLVPLLETLGEAIEERLLRKLQGDAP